MRSKVVKAALDLDEVSTFHHIGMSPEEFVEFAKAAPEYNGLKKKTFLAVAEHINKNAPRMDFGGDNPNNGNHFASLRVGNEGSRVVYLDMDRFYFGGSKEREAEMQKFLLTLMNKAQRANVDEYTMDDEKSGIGRKLTIRMWWD